MKSIRQALFIGVAVMGFVIGMVSISSAQSATYTYDALNRLILVEYGDGNVIWYIYDQAGNRIYVGTQDTTPPVTTASPASGTFFNTTLSVTLTCNDGTGPGCNICLESFLIDAIHRCHSELIWFGKSYKLAFYGESGLPLLCP